MVRIRQIKIMSAGKDVQKNTSKLDLRDYVKKFNALSMVFDTMPTGVFAVLDQKSNIATINKTASEILGSDPQALIGKNAREVFESSFPGH